MLKRELKSNLKSFIIWTLVCVILFFVAFIIYPSIIDTEKADMLNEMMQAFPPEMLKMFNMDISDINNVFGWFKTEGYMFLVLIVGFYSSILGGTILVKEESDKTIEFLYSKPISRNKIIASKIICSLIYIISMILLITLFNYIGMSISGDFEFKSFILLSISPLFIALPLYSIILFISTFFNKTKKTTGISLGITFIFYFIQIISNMGENVEFFKYFTPFSLSDSRNIISNSTINIWCIIISILLTILFLSFTYIGYNKKELV